MSDRTLIIVITTALTVFCVSMVACGWVFGGVPIDSIDWASCVGTHILAAGSVGALVWAVRRA